MTEPVPQKERPISDIPRDGALRVWHIPLLGVPPFYVPVLTVDAAKLVLVTLAEYDLFCLEQGVRPEDFSNMSGLDVYAGGTWMDWEDPETGEDIWRVIADEDGLETAL
jgi:hypothetical protein